METLHTPGPWSLADIHANGFYGNNGEAMVTSAERRICEVDCVAPFKKGQGYLANCDERDANARLIAAAPAMLSALEHIDRICAPGESDPEEMAIALAGIARIAMVAVAQARGEG